MEQNNLALNMRLTKLEESYFSLSAHLEGERVLRKVEDDKCRQLFDILAKEISEVKEKDPMESLKDVFKSLKDELFNEIDAKIDSKILENKKNLEIQYINCIEKINKNNNIENTDNINNELKKYKNEINTINKKLEYIDNSFDKKMQEISNKIDNINNNNKKYLLDNNNIINKINDFNKTLLTYKNEQKNNMDKINIKIKEQINSLYDNIESKINNIHINNMNNEQKNNFDLNNIDNNLSILKSDFDSLSHNYLREIDELRKNMSKEINLKNKEISNFEQHFLMEFENFTKFITDILNQNIDKIKSMNEYMNSDIEIVKNKNQYLEETLLKMREDVYDSMEKNIKYILDKIHSYLDLQNGNINNSYGNENINEINSNNNEQ